MEEIGLAKNLKIHLFVCLKLLSVSCLFILNFEKSYQVSLESPPGRSMRTSTLATDDRVTSLARVLAGFAGSVTRAKKHKQPKHFTK